ncbi:MAG: hypothetical protein PHQ36_10725 [Anaerolineales bacterium]|nr:hypothetical protein [Anaerolineales bacterium]
MTVKAKAKPKTKPKVKAAKLKVEKKKAVVKSVAKAALVKKETAAAPSSQVAEKTAAVVKPKIIAPVVKRTIIPALERRRPIKKKPSRGNQFNFMKAPGLEHEFQVGDTVEVFCDHEKNRERIRDWVKGIVVQVDYKMAAVQFRFNVYLTDGWMVPDRILWFPLHSEHIRPVAGKKPAAKKDFIPDY